MLDVAEYKARHENLPFLSYGKRPAIYDDSIDNAATVGARAKLDNWKTFDYTQRKLRAFGIACM